MESFLKIEKGRWQRPIEAHWILTSVPSKLEREMDQLIKFTLATPPEKFFRDEDRKMSTRVRLQLRHRRYKNLQMQNSF